jgi:hypothetical protein
MGDNDDWRIEQGKQETLLWRVAMSLVAVCVLGAFAACSYGCAVTNRVYQETMIKCIDSGGTFVPKGDTAGICFMTGVTKHE